MLALQCNDRAAGQLSHSLGGKNVIIVRLVHDHHLPHLSLVHLHGSVVGLLGYCPPHQQGHQSAAVPSSTIRTGPLKRCPARTDQPSSLHYQVEQDLQGIDDKNTGSKVDLANLFLLIFSVLSCLANSTPFSSSVAGMVYTSYEREGQVWVYPEGCPEGQGGTERSGVEQVDALSG